MKLKLEPYKDLSILSVSGPITVENFAVLRAGIKKLFKDGKNKIVLEIDAADQLSPEILREIAMMNVIASELSGQIVLSKIDPTTQSKIESYSKPPFVRSFKNRDEALLFFHPPQKEEKTNDTPQTPEVTAPASPTVTPPLNLNPTATTPAEDPGKKFKEDIRKSEMGDVGQLRKKISELEKENKEIKNQLTTLLLQRRDPPDLTAWQTKVATLEKQLEEVVTQLNAQQPPKAAAATDKK